MTSTAGSLFLDDEFQCFTLEDVVREIRGIPVERWKIPGRTAIPAGTYPVIINHSAHFGRDLPLLLDVPGFEGVRIHTGNSGNDTEGCILVGWAVNGETITGSHRAFDPLFEKLKSANSITIEIRNDHGQG
jgi:hypothetical protein